MKYVTYKGHLNQTWSINRGNIVGFTSKDPFIVGCHIILDSGYEIFLNGIDETQAKAILAEFDSELGDEK